jgi:hypothetical protein
VIVVHPANAAGLPLATVVTSGVVQDHEIVRTGGRGQDHVIAISIGPGHHMTDGGRGPVTESDGTVVRLTMNTAKLKTYLLNLSSGR